MYIATDFHIPTRPCFNFPSRPAERLLEKGSGAINEDVLLHDRDLFGVFDGATSLDSNSPLPGATGGLLAARIAAHAFQTGGSDLFRSAELANHRIKEAIDKHGIAGDERHLFWSTSAAVVHVTEKALDYCQIGDSLILLIMDDGQYQLLTPEVNHDLETLMIWKNLPWSPGINIRIALAEQIKKVRLQMNRQYGALNGEAAALDFINCGQVALDGVETVLLFTDGLFLPKQNPQQESDWATFVTCYQQGGLQKLAEYVRTLQQNDPTCHTYPRFKMHDDIAALAINVTA